MIPERGTLNADTTLRFEEFFHEGRLSGAKCPFFLLLSSPPPSSPFIDSLLPVDTEGSFPISLYALHTLGLDKIAR